MNLQITRFTKLSIKLHQLEIQYPEDKMCMYHKHSTTTHWNSGMIGVYYGKNVRLLDFVIN